MTRSWRFALAGFFVALSVRGEQPSQPAAFGVLHDNGPFVNSPGTGAGGADESALQSASGMTIFGFTHTAAVWLADDFTVPGPNGWWVDSVTFFGYVTGSTLDSPFTGAYVRIWNGPPNDAGSVVVFGSTPENGLRYTTWSGAYRIQDTMPGATNRPIMANTVRLGVTLPPGTYWMEWWTTQSGAGSTFAPPITINGQLDTGNALQYNGAWIAAVDGAHPQGFPFVLRGRQVSCRVPAMPIPDGDPAGVEDSFTFGAGTGLIDVNVYAAATHSQVSNLVFQLTHENTATSVTVLNHPVCVEEDVAATFDDEASVAVSALCDSTSPAIGGRVFPDSLLAPFDGQSSVGTWTLNAADDGEDGATGVLGTWCLDLMTPTFADVPAGSFGVGFIEALYAAEVTGGCGTAPLIYCPGNPVTRAQMAVFLLRGQNGPYFGPGTATGAVFDDVGTGTFAAAWIERLAAEGITGGCSVTPPLYCPGSNVTRAQMAVFLLRAKHGSGYSPPPATGLVFEDVASGDFAAAWIEALFAEGITGGCQVSPPRYCPAASVTRAQMAVFLVRTFGLPLP